MADILYHGSATKITGPLTPILRHGSEDHVHDRAAVFATERADIASLFMIPTDVLSSIGFEHDVAYICIWGAAEEFAARDRGGYLYGMPGTTFEKIGKGYEWQSFAPVTPSEIRAYPSIIDGMIDNGAQVYFVNDDETFDAIVRDKDRRAPILAGRTSENRRQGRNERRFASPAEEGISPQNDISA
jgi:hypothetical protein